jgi:hypothetical protein
MSTILPTNSCPATSGGCSVRWAHSSQFQMCRSVPQIAVWVTFTRRSFPPIWGTGTSSMTSPWPARFFTRAFMRGLMEAIIA